MSSRGPCTARECNGNRLLKKPVLFHSFRLTWCVVYAATQPRHCKVTDIADSLVLTIDRTIDSCSTTNANSNRRSLIDSALFVNSCFIIIIDIISLFLCITGQKPLQRHTTRFLILRYQIFSILIFFSSNMHFPININTYRFIDINICIIINVISR